MTYFPVFASLNALLIPVVWLFFPETAGRSLEGETTSSSRRFWSSYTPTDMDVIFAVAYKEGVSPVAVSLRRDVPEAGTPEADEILGIKRSDSNGEKKVSF